MVFAVWNTIENRFPAPIVCDVLIELRAVQDGDQCKAQPSNNPCSDLHQSDVVFVDCYLRKRHLSDSAHMG